MFLPSSGTILGDMSKAIDPHKIGNVMWTRTDMGCLIPYDLHHRLSIEDERGLDMVGGKLLAFRKVTPILEAIKSHPWHAIDIIKPYLIESTKGRAQSREMIAQGEWDEFWNFVN